MEMFAIATLITNVAWFLIGEVDFKRYCLGISEYIYAFVIMILFIFCGQIPNAILGCAIYVCSSIVFMLIFMNSTFRYCLKEIFNYIKKFARVEQSN